MQIHRIDHDIEQIIIGIINFISEKRRKILEDLKVITKLAHLK
jgi:hypothetical protein